MSSKNPTEEVAEECTLAGCPGEPCIGGIGCEKEELYIEPNPTEEELAEEIRVTEMVYEAIEQAEEKAEEEIKQTITHKGFAEDSYQQELIRYAYSIGGLDFVKLIECENGGWNPKAVGDNGKAFGLCQMNTNYHKLPQEYYDNAYFQLDYCFAKWKSGTKFYGPSRIIKGKKCANYVSDRFIFNLLTNEL